MAVCYRMTAVSSLFQVGLLLLLLGRNSGRPSEKCTSGTSCQPTRPPVVLSKCFKHSWFCLITLVTYQLHNFSSLDICTFRRQQSPSEWNRCALHHPSSRLTLFLLFPPRQTNSNSFTFWPDCPSKKQLFAQPDELKHNLRLLIYAV